MNLCFRHIRKTATCTHDTISYAPTAVNSVTRHDVFVCTLLHRELCANIQFYNLD